MTTLGFCSHRDQEQRTRERDRHIHEMVAETWDLIGHDPEVMRSLIELGNSVLREPN